MSKKKKKKVCAAAFPEREQQREGGLFSESVSAVSLCIPLHGRRSGGRLKVNSWESVAPSAFLPARNEVR